MIGDSQVELIWVVFWATVLNSIGPVCQLYCSTAAIFSSVPRWPLILAIPEGLFFVWMYIYLQTQLQRATVHPIPNSRRERQILFDRCLATTNDFEKYISDWFFKAPTSAMGRENIKEFIRWAFLNTDILDHEHDEEVESYLKQVEEKLGTRFPPGRTDVKCLRLTIDKVDALHRSLTWYMCIFVVDIITHLYLRFHEFNFYRTSVAKSFTILPPRPQALITSQSSPCEHLSYWYRPHTSTKELPILFLHGIGVGLWPYMQFLKEINQGRSEENGQIGILAVELLPISSRFTSAMPPSKEMCQQIRSVLDHHRLSEVVLMTHSYGSVIATHILKTPDLATRISSVILIDPVSILLNQPDVAYNFTVRKPRLASEWLLWYFGSKDIGVAHTLSRTFFWSENILWREDLAGRRFVVFLSERDSIVNAGKVRRYLEGERDAEEVSGHKLYNTTEISHTKKGDVCGEIGDDASKLVWCDGLNHGQVFDIQSWRDRLKREVLQEVKRRCISQ